MKQLLDGDITIAELFIENNNFFYTKNFYGWIDEIKNLYSTKKVVALLGEDTLMHAFDVSIKRYDKDSFIVSFTDISSTMQKHLKSKSIHDKLTDAYNREFFDNNIEEIIKANKPNMTAIALCDIDFFKKTNNTYGHIQGDVVLKEIVEILKNSTRKGDYIIRWGGEEFIIVLKLEDSSLLETILQHLRENIKKHNFQNIDQITCSFGATIIKNAEEIKTSISRADIALYNAKTNGRDNVKIKL
jgi:diguanylate cyclase (GGDEF)-like protein